MAYCVHELPQVFNQTSIPKELRYTRQQFDREFPPMMLPRAGQGTAIPRRMAVCQKCEGKRKHYA